MKPQRETIGTVACYLCGRSAQVRADKNGKLYYLCDRSSEWAGCGKITPNLNGGQQLLREAMVPVSKSPAAEPKPAPAPAPEEHREESKPAPASKPAATKKGLLDW